jgi:hypothetical protein
MQRHPGIDWLIQMSANLVGTVLAAGVIYVIGVLAGAINGTTALNVLSAVTVGLSAVFAAYQQLQLRSRHRDDR